MFPCETCQALQRAYRNCLKQFSAFRTFHLGIATKYGLSPGAACLYVAFAALPSFSVASPSWLVGAAARNTCFALSTLGTSSALKLAQVRVIFGRCYARLAKTRKPACLQCFNAPPCSRNDVGPRPACRLLETLHAVDGSQPNRNRDECATAPSFKGACAVNLIYMLEQQSMSVGVIYLVCGTLSQSLVNCEK